MADLGLTLEELERDPWPDPGPTATTLVRRCTDLRRKPLRDFGVGDLRIMLGQEIGVGVGPLLRTRRQSSEAGAAANSACIVRRIVK